MLKRVSSCAFGVPLLLVILYEATFDLRFYGQSTGLSHRKYGVRAALRWQDIVFLVFIWPIWLMLVYVPAAFENMLFARKRVATIVVVKHY